ncbi:hypothetical protein TNIN_91631 [Trichonephila inaurata madagascariensis]|uniref:Secreted protein n=1 Tax=Trichonephila inaurata madagascariensis TaxID=2747483 RepID=A0A8X6JSX4_9ARAC|nr:hypothetical protein TNIN_289361 [Trichonephila inaurata madagascariensis]GFS57943.1 hypothetical protein TNIN_91631 [Trichonephila inaurata madagascariensis]
MKNYQWGVGWKRCVCVVVCDLVWKYCACRERPPQAEKDGYLNIFGHRGKGSANRLQFPRSSGCGAVAEAAVFDCLWENFCRPIGRQLLVWGRGQLEVR